MGFAQRYQKRISGPLMERIDIHRTAMRVPFEKLSSLDGGEPSSAIRACVEAARAVQAERFALLYKPHVLVKGDMRPARRFRATAHQTICSASVRSTRRS